jgi:hypothetical protein
MSTVKVPDNADVCFVVGLGGPSTLCLDDRSVALAECGECVRFDYGPLVEEEEAEEEEKGVGGLGRLLVAREKELEEEEEGEESGEEGGGRILRVTEGKVCVVSLVPLAGEKRSKW